MSQTDVLGWLFVASFIVMMVCALIAFIRSLFVRRTIVAPARQLRHCHWCRNETDLFCKAEIAPGRTCEAPVCYRHRTARGEHDYCPRHAMPAPPPTAFRELARKSRLQ